MIDRRIKFRHIQSFVEIAREKSLKRAAEKLFLTQPAISKTLKELEEIVEAPLMTRSRSGVALTEEGQVFLHFAQMSLASLQQGLDGVERAGRKEKEKLTIGALPSVAAWIMPKVVREFDALAPDAALQIVDGPHGYLVDRLRHGQLDLVIGRLGRPETMQGISFTQLYNEQVEFVVRPGHPLLKDPNLHKIADWQVIFPPEGSAIRPLVERFLIACGIGEIPNRVETVSGAFGRVYTRQTDAIWIISGGVVANEIADGRLVKLPINTELTQGPVGLMTRPDVAPTPIQQVFRLAVQNVVSGA
ncbi:Hca operon transcriptional activator [Ruegeria denitrificans]|uniref:Hca operon transcriptional activator n=1 Tax=Ruegeria denitrificans TaxID=1715692 RepID=A0A0P1I8E3_9RHOB|nr:pca operon transcription factor PcaQ [Ruegeria denitrificans]CUJ97075.1 Hca operon transcriptional activator [Ruegeria denitrificans]